MSDERDTFLSRWSRRKLEVQSPPPPARVEDPPAEPAESEETGPELTAEEIEALPKLDDLTPETDITVFLRKGVPETLKKAALRRIWSLDPAIRDYVGDARDYAYDWNIPGNVPGNGPLLPCDDVDSMLTRIFEDPPGSDAPGDRLAGRNPPSQSGEPEGSPPADPPPEEVPLRAAPQQDADRPDVDFLKEDRAGARAIAAEGEVDRGAPPSEDSGKPRPAPAPRRHGGAKPV